MVTAAAFCKCASAAQGLEPQPGMPPVPGSSTLKEPAAVLKPRSTARQRGSGHCPFSVYSRSFLCGSKETGRPFSRSLTVPPHLGQREGAAGPVLAPVPLYRHSGSRARHRMRAHLAAYTDRLCRKKDGLWTVNSRV